MISAYMDVGRSIRIARVDFRNDGRVFSIKDEDRFLHVYIIGKTGTGKSTLIGNDGASGWICPN
jgi:DNA helicase HerA-like ATPase